LFPPVLVVVPLVLVVVPVAVPVEVVVPVALVDVDDAPPVSTRFGVSHAAPPLPVANAKHNAIAVRCFMFSPSFSSEREAHGRQEQSVCQRDASAFCGAVEQRLLNLLLGWTALAQVGQVRTTRRTSSRAYRLYVGA